MDHSSSLHLLPAYAGLALTQSAFKILDSSGHTEWLSMSFVFCFLQEICISFMLYSQRENQRKICLGSSLWGSVLDPD